MVFFATDCGILGRNLAYWGSGYVENAEDTSFADLEGFVDCFGCNDYIIYWLRQSLKTYQS